MTARVQRLVLSLAVVALCTAGVASPASASVQIDPFTVTPLANSIAPEPFQAGAHPDLRLFQKFCPDFCTDEERLDNPKDLTVHLPGGLLANPRATAIRCALEDLQANQCPPESTVGGVRVRTVGVADQPAEGDVYNVEPIGGEAARLGVVVRLNTSTGPFPAPPTIISATLRPTDYGVDTLTLELPTFAGPVPIRINEIDLTLCGQVPAAPLPALVGAGEATSQGLTCKPLPGVSQRPFMTNPTACVPTVIALELNSYNEPDVFTSASAGYTPTGCDSVPFDPGVEVTRQNPATGFDVDDPGAPVGFKVGVTFPPSELDPVHQAHLNRAEVKLPPGVAVSPGAAQGLEGCSSAQFGLGTNDPARCPAGSDIGDVSVETPVLDGDPSTPNVLDPLTGDVYFGEPSAPGPPTAANPWGILVEITGGGVRVKLAGEVTVDPATGQVKTVFEDTPQTPFTRFELTLRGGDRALLANPTTCGTAELSATMTPWSAAHLADPSVKAKTVTAPITTTGCQNPVPFQPTIAASADPTQAGANTHSRLVIERPDGHQLLSGLSLSLPPGAAASLASVQLCAASAAQAGACSTDSKVGNVTTRVGAGPGQLEVAGSLYLAEPVVAGDAASLALVIPTKVGPIDLGEVVVINRVKLRQSDGGIDVESSDIPTALGGIPLPVRRVQIDVDRAGFFRNPTGCDARAFVATFRSGAGASASASALLAATGCEALPFAPRLRIIAEAEGETKRFAHPGIRAIVTQTDGEANIAGSRVALPQILRPDTVPLNAPGGLCQQAQFEANACPGPSRVGHATAYTPLLANPLSGPIYVVQRQGRVLPDLAVQLQGQVALNLFAQNAIEGVRTVNTFSGLPDVPVTSFELFIQGGKTGLLKNFHDLCTAATDHADATFTAQSGKVSSSKPELEIVGCAPPGIKILSRSVRATKRGKAKVRLKCLAEERCTGRLTLKTRGKVRIAARRKARKRKITLGSKTFKIASGKTKTVKFKIRRRARRALRLRANKRRLRVRASVGPKVVGAFASTARNVTVKAAKRKKAKRSRGRR